MSYLGKMVLLSRWLFTDQPTTAAIDVTHRCNLHCSHCYWWRQEHPPELDDLEMIRFMQTLRASGLRAAILYGGEPTLRPRVCRAASEIFDATLAFTNGTNGFPELHNGQWILSLDGPGDVNDAIRGNGTYKQAVENLRHAGRPPIVHMTISRVNRNSIDNFVKEILSLPIKGIGFSFLTPDVEDGDDLALNLEERDKAVEGLLRLRSAYGEKIGFTLAMARQLKSNGAFGRWNHYAKCPVTKRVRCYRSDGTRKACTYGDNADCSRCGCAAVVVFRGAFKPFDLETVRLILGLVYPGLMSSGKRKGVSSHRESKHTLEAAG